MMSTGPVQGRERLSKAQVEFLLDCWRFRDEGGCPLERHDRMRAKAIVARNLARFSPNGDRAVLTETGRAALEATGRRLG